MLSIVKKKKYFKMKNKMFNTAAKKTKIFKF